MSPLGQSAATPAYAQVQLKKDFSDVVERDLPGLREKALQPGNLETAIDEILDIEKKSRHANDMKSTRSLCKAVLEVVIAAGEVSQLPRFLLVVSKRRGQLKQVVTACVRFVLESASSGAAGSEEQKLKWVKGVREVTEGKIYLEVEHARVTHVLAKAMEEDGDVHGASELIQEVQVETFGGMNRREKAEYILEQMRLCLADKNWVHAGLVAQKVGHRTLNDPELQDVRMAYYEKMVQLHEADHDYNAIMKDLASFYNTPKVKEDPVLCEYVLSSLAVFSLLTPHSNEQVDQLNRLAKDPNMTATDRLSGLQTQVSFLLEKHLVSWSDVKDSMEEINGEWSPLAPEAFSKRRWEDLHSRVTEFNVRVIANAYEEVSLERVAELLQQSVDVAEETISKQVTRGDVHARIDRPAGVVKFATPSTAAQSMDEWVSNISTFLDRTESCSQAIQKECAINNVTL